jgi:hypothetical protein
MIPLRICGPTDHKIVTGACLGLSIGTQIFGITLRFIPVRRGAIEAGTALRSSALHSASSEKAGKEIERLDIWKLMVGRLEEVDG